MHCACVVVIITTILDINLSTEASLEEVGIALDDLPRGETIKLKVLRAGKEIMIEMIK